MTWGCIFLIIQQAHYFSRLHKNESNYSKSLNTVRAIGVSHTACKNGFRNFNFCNIRVKFGLLFLGGSICTLGRLEPVLSPRTSSWELMRKQHKALSNTFVSRHEINPPRIQITSTTASATRSTGSLPRLHHELPGQSKRSDCFQVFRLPQASRGHPRRLLHSGRRCVPRLRQGSRPLPRYQAVRVSGRVQLLPVTVLDGHRADIRHPGELL